MRATPGSNASSRAGQFFVAIRPSIIRRLGYGAMPLDLLDDDGIAGWELGVRRLLRDLSNLDHAAARPHVNVWLLRDLEAERSRWQQATTMLWHLEYVLRQWPETKTTEGFTGVWERNIDAARIRARRSRTLLAASDQNRIERIIELLTSTPHHDSLIAAVELLRADVPLGDNDGTYPAGYLGRRVLKPIDRRLLKSWLAESDLIRALT